jgi:hypothetical protein
MSTESANALQRYFAGISEHVFYLHLGVSDTELIDYVSGLLVRFTKTESMLRIRQLNGRPATEVVAMMAEAQQRIGQAKRAIHQHIGDFTLFWTGLYPEALRELQGPDRRDQFVSYCEQGKRAYAVASQIDADEDEGASNTLLRRLSAQFEMCAYGLREIRREWEVGDEDKPGKSGPILLI